jgi:glycosyltransferase involved in cell wall biosynthesis
MKRGQEKNLNLGTDFDYACYEQELSPTERKLFSSRLLAHYLAYGQRAGLRPNYRYDEMRDRERRAEFVAAIDSKLPTVLMICHNLGGGTEIHVRDLARLYRGRLNCLLLKVDSHGVARVALLERTRELVLGFDSVLQLPQLLSLISDVGTRRIHVHHVIRINAFARLLVERCGLPFDFTAHDHSILAPSPHLTGRDHRFVGEDLEAAEAELLAASRVKGTPDIASWRRDMSWLVTKSERIIAPSLDLARRLTNSLAPPPLIVAPHPDLSEQQSLERTRPSSAELLHIVTLGRLWPHKGFHVLRELARIAWEEALPLSFTHIGRSVKDEQLAELGVRVTGEYAERHLRLLLAKAKPHLIWFPALAPESFSYTLTTALRTGLPLVVPDLGSFPERVADRQWTWVRPWDTGPREWAKFYLEIRDRHFLTGTPPDPAPATPFHEVSYDFYERRYLDWVQQD